MKYLVTRASVAAGDDADFPHARTFVFPDTLPVEEVVANIAASDYLAKIEGGKATWSVVSGFPVAVVAQQWPEPRHVSSRPVKHSALQHKDGVVCLRFNYHAQLDPEFVLEVLKRLRLSAL